MKTHRCNLLYDGEEEDDRYTNGELKSNQVVVTKEK